MSVFALSRLLRRRITAFHGALAATLILVPQALAHIQVSYSLGRIISDSSNILLMNIEKVDREKNLIIYRKVRDIKGAHPGEVIKHDIGQRGYSAIEWQNVMQAAEAGRPAVMFHNGGIGEICIDRYWYQARAGEWWTMIHDEPIFLLTFTGRPEQLAAAVANMLAGQEVILPCMAPAQGSTALAEREKTWAPLRSRRGKMLRMKAHMKLLDYNFNRDFVGWGAEEYKGINDMPGFTHSMSLGRMGGGGAGIEAGDINGDGKPDICAYTPAKVQVMNNDGGVLADISLPIRGGARGAAWADFSGDGKTDLFVAGVAGPRLFLGDGKALADATDRLPPCPYPNFTACAKADFDGDGRTDILLADGFRGLRLYRGMENLTNRLAAPKTGAKPVTPALPPLFEDVSDSVGLGETGVAGDLRGDSLSIADVDGDRRPDILFSAGRGVLILNKPTGFVLAPAGGIAFAAGGVTPAFGDANGDGKPDLFVPQKDSPSKLFINIGSGKFRECAADSPDLRSPIGWATSAAWCNLQGKGAPGLLVGCLKGPNRYFANNGRGVFADAGEAIGLDRRILNTRGVAALDLNADSAVDLILGNEGQDWLVLLGAGIGGANANR